MSWLRTPGEGAYARDELERRWLVPALPEGLVDERTVTDRYVHDTRLRLRTVEGGGTVVRKLAQKVPHGRGARLTNLYLDEAEAAVLHGLPAAVLRKTRWTWTYAGRVFALDRHADGTLLAETDVVDLTAPVEVPAGWVEVTGDERWTGAALAYGSATKSSRNDRADGVSSR